MKTKEKNQSKRRFTYDGYLKEFLKIDPHKTVENNAKPFDIGISLANTDLVELKKALTNLHLTTRK